MMCGAAVVVFRTSSVEVGTTGLSSTVCGCTVVVLPAPASTVTAPSVWLTTSVVVLAILLIAVLLVGIIEIISLRIVVTVAGPSPGAVVTPAATPTAATPASPPAAPAAVEACK